MSIFEGSAVALVTPFSENGVNYAALESLIEFQIENGTDAILVCGTTGEPATMTSEERESVIKFAVRQVNGRVPVIAGAGGNNTAASLEASLFAEGAGADALLIVTPYYNKCSQEGLLRPHPKRAGRADGAGLSGAAPHLRRTGALPPGLPAVRQRANGGAAAEHGGDKADQRGAAPEDAGAG